MTTARARLVKEAVSLLRDAARRTPVDPTVEVIYTRVGSAAFLDALGSHPENGRMRTPIERDGKPIAALLHPPGLARDAERLRAAVEAASLAIENERLRAELRDQLGDVQASRTRLVQAADRERQRVERNLHDGAQQRLVGLALTLRLAEREKLDPAVAHLLEDALHELHDALDDLRRLARGVHPAIVSEAGLPGALESLAERSVLPVDLAVDVPTRLPDAVEVAAYYCVAEALANTRKHAQATGVTVRAAIVDDALVVSVADDGCGGAVPAAGSGLEGLADRISALGGRFAVESPPDHGTTVAAWLPVVLTEAPGRPARHLAAIRWMGWENWEIPAEVYLQITDEDNLNFAKGTLLCAGGRAVLTERERDWYDGYRAACGDADWVLDAVRNYDDTDRIEDVGALPSMQLTVRGMVHDALRLCASDGALTTEEHDRITDGAAGLGIAREVVEEIRGIVEDEHALRRRRYATISGPMFLLGSP
ncbi:histidine kinase [Sporichthya polymorpha]|uniref:histidine kinase n=1 Tax=Sporichthya polymorpha TaxID=35751 RepID=UPI000375BA03|nr:histidine kinase [Sporichthya polymorpha]